jgi:hypothetical protein
MQWVGGFVPKKAGRTENPLSPTTIQPLRLATPQIGSAHREKANYCAASRSLVTRAGVKGASV